MLVSLDRSVYFLLSASAEEIAASSVGDMSFKVGKVVSLAARIGNVMLAAAATTTLTERRLFLIA